MPRTSATACLVALLSAMTVARGAPTDGSAPARQSVPEDVCGWRGRTPAEHARQLARLAEPERDALVSVAQSRDSGEVLCGVAGLAALGDRRVIPPLVAALRNPALRADAYQLARWATFLAGGPESDLGAAMRAVVEVFDDPALRDAAGNDAFWFFGDVDHDTARERLLAAVDQSLSDAALDGVIHGLARQGEPRARATIAALGLDAVRAKSGNATREQADRLGEVAFYQLALGPDSLADGITTLRAIAPRDQEAAAAWAVHTLCARAVRRPSQRAAIDAQRVALVEALGRLGISWHTVKGRVGCEPTP